MEKEIVQGLLIPFLGTALGAACVFFVRGELNWRIPVSYTHLTINFLIIISPLSVK